MKKFSPMLVGGILCSVVLAGYAAVKHGTDRPEYAPASDEAPDPTKNANHSALSNDEAGAVRINFSDLDLLKLADMQSVSRDCAEKIPESIRQLQGKRILFRGFMKPCGVSTELPEFLFVRSTDMCCFARVGRVDHMAVVKLKPKTTTDYLERTPFDVAGQFRIDVVTMEENGALEVVYLYHLDDAVIIQR